MSNKKGFTLIEILVVLLIIGVMTAIIMPGYNTMVTQGAATAAQNNLIAIYNAQKNYNAGPGNGLYYTSGSPNDQSGINAALTLNISDTNFNYTCATAAGPSFTCTATGVSNTQLVLTVTSGTPAVPNQIILPGGAGCTANTGGAPCNPYCLTGTTNPAFCPNN